MKTGTPLPLRDKVENKIYGKERAGLRRKAEQLFNEAMQKVTHMVTIKKKQIKNLDYKELLKNLRFHATKHPDEFWGKIEEEMAKAGAVGIENLFELSPANMILHNARKEAVDDLQKYGMTLSFPASNIVTDIFYKINHELDVTTDMTVLESWVPDGWEEIQKEKTQNELPVQAEQSEPAAIHDINVGVGSN